MIKNYLKIAWRHMTRHKGYALINVLGLTLGITCCLFISLWVRDEESVDHFKGRNIYNVFETVKGDGQTYGSFTTPGRVTDSTHYTYYLEDVKKAIPEVRNVVFY